MSVRVLHVLPHTGGGGETYIGMLERLHGFAHQRFYLSAGRTPQSALRSIPSRWPQLAARLRSVDLIHVHGDAASAIVLPLLRIRPTVMTTHGLHLLRRLEGTQRRLMERALSGLVSTSRAVICTSATERDELLALVRERDREKLRVIHNGTDPLPPLDEHERRSVRAQLGIGPGTVLGLFVGVLEPRKAPLLAARAAVRVRAAGAPFVLLVAGDGPQAQQLQALAGEAVGMLGHRSDVQRLLAAADLFLAPSEREGMSLALLEAMARGLPIIAADGAEMAETVAESALLFPTGDDAALTAALTKLITQPALRAELGASARARALERFSTAAFLAATETVYRQSLGLTAPAPDAAAPPA